MNARIWVVFLTAAIAGANVMATAAPSTQSADVESLRAGAAKGDAGAMFSLGVAYQLGNGVSQDYQQAMTWYRQAADAGNAVASKNVGVMYENGYGVPQDYQQAMWWYSKAADGGNVDGMTAAAACALWTRRSARLRKCDELVSQAADRAARCHGKDRPVLRARPQCPV